MNSIAKIILNNIDNDKCFFVFPSGIAVDIWTEKILDLLEEQTIVTERFLAWDVFKKMILSSHINDKTAVSDSLRSMFAKWIIEKNKDSEQKIFGSLINQKYANDADVFVEWLSALLPSLGEWKLKKQSSNVPYDDEDEDLLKLISLYQKFLDENNLFEPAWQDLLQIELTCKYFIFYPELISDFAKYNKFFIEQKKSIELIWLESEDIDKKDLFIFENTIDELKWIANTICGLNKNRNIDFTDMAISIPDIENLESYVFRELDLHAIPFKYRLGKNLSQYSSGRFFSLVQECVLEKFSFSSLKSLLLYDQLPWKEKKLNIELIEFGIKNNCVCCFENGGKCFDVWKEAFSKYNGEERLCLYFQKLKASIQAIVKAESFGEIISKYILFRDDFFDVENFTLLADSVMGRCIEELHSLNEQIGTIWKKLNVLNPFSFFVSYISKKKYAPQTLSQGVNIFPYRVAAATPFKCHFIINLNQKSTTVLYSSMKFLRSDKRASLGYFDENVSDSFFKAYSLKPFDDSEHFLYFSCSKKTFSGYVNPSSYFSQFNIEDNNNSSWTLEKKWWKNNDNPFPDVIFSNQKREFDTWVARKNKLLPVTKPKLLKHNLDILLRKNQFGDYSFSRKCIDKLRISTTSMDNFFYCGTKFLFDKVLKLERVSFNAIVTPTSLGIYFHDVVEKVLLKIKNEKPGGILLRNDINEYNMWISECLEQAVYNAEKFQGALLAPIFQTEIDENSRIIRRCFENFVCMFEQYSVANIEEEFYIESDKSFKTGKIDCILLNPIGDEAFLIDFKTGDFPKKSDCLLTDDNKLMSHQFAFYTSIYEMQKGKGVIQQAAIVRLKSGKIDYLFGKDMKIIDINGKETIKKAKKTRDDFQREVDFFENDAIFFEKSVLEKRFTNKYKIDFKCCVSCVYKNICRTTYFVSGEKECQISLC